MNGTHVTQYGGARIALVAGLVVAIGALALSAPSDAKRIRGTNGPDKLKGTKKKDKIKGRGGDDKLTGRKGKDKLGGGGGDDKLKGGKGKDAHKGGGRNDSLNAVDRRADKSVSGGPGNDTCRIDMVDLQRTTGCETLDVVGGGGGGPGPGGPGAPGGGGLVVTGASGLSCGSQLPTCLFQIDGTGADFLVGTVTGRGGVSLAAGVGVSIQPNGDWTAAGLYGCTEAGFLRVTIGSESVDVPITCTT
jgi:RTX calcium-binding nonapeptide repeat (4 copies)